MPGALESIAYALGRGITRAWLDVQAERNVALQEKPTDEDRTHTDRMRDAVLLAQGQGGAGSNGGAPSGG